MVDKADYYRCTEAFGVMFRGEHITVAAGEVVPKDSPLLKQVGLEHFAPVESFGRWDVEEATAAPGAKRGSRKAAD